MWWWEWGEGGRGRGRRGHPGVGVEGEDNAGAAHGVDVAWVGEGVRGRLYETMEFSTQATAAPADGMMKSGGGSTDEFDGVEVACRERESNPDLRRQDF